MKKQKGGCVLRRFRELFTVPEGESVTEKHFRRILISSVCSIMLCLTCLISVTWAWFKVSVKTEFGITIAETVTKSITMNLAEQPDEAADLPLVDQPIVKIDGNTFRVCQGQYTVTYEIEKDANIDSFGNDYAGYIVVTINEEDIRVIDLDTIEGTYTQNDEKVIIKYSFGLNIIAAASEAEEAEDAEETSPEAVWVELLYDFSWQKPADAAEWTITEDGSFEVELDASVSKETLVEESVTEETETEETTLEEAAAEETTEEEITSQETPAAESTEYSSTENTSEEEDTASQTETSSPVGSSAESESVPESAASEGNDTETEPTSAEESLEGYVES